MCIHSNVLPIRRRGFEFHLQESMQRVNMDAQPNDFAAIIMDELNPDKIKKLKTACHEIAVKGDFIKYKNIYSGVLTECSSQSAGIQLADFAAGIMNGYLRGLCFAEENMSSQPTCLMSLYYLICAIIPMVVLWVTE